MRVVPKFMHQYLSASDVDKGASSKCKNECTYFLWNVTQADANGNTCWLNKGQCKENEEYCHLGLSLMLSERDAEGDSGRDVMQADSNHEVDENTLFFDHSESDSFEYWVKPERKQKNQGCYVDTAYQEFLLKYVSAAWMDDSGF